MKKRPSTEEVLFNGLPACPEQDALEAQFFQRVLLPNGTFKTTCAHRLDDLNAFVLPYLKELSARPLRIMDVGASSGVSTAEWQQSLKSDGIDSHITATDLTVEADLVKLGHGLTMLVDRNKHVLHMDVLGIGIIGRAKRIRRLPIWAVRTGIKAVLNAKLILGYEPQTERVNLLSRRFSQSDSLLMLEDDISKDSRPDFLQAFHVVRAANILNSAYFPCGVLSRMAAHLKSRLTQDGLLIVCRTDQTGTNNATLFRAVTNGDLQPVARLNRGSEVESVIQRAQ